jgi:hypothetical protein
MGANFADFLSGARRARPKCEPTRVSPNAQRDMTARLSGEAPRRAPFTVARQEGRSRCQRRKEPP